MSRAVPVLLTGAGDATRNAQNGGGTASSSCAKPANTADGDVLIAFVSHQLAFTNAAWTMVENSGTWTHLGPVPAVGSYRRSGGIWVLPVTAGAASLPAVALGSLPASWTWSQNSGSTGRWVIRIARITGVDLAAIVDAQAAAWDTSVSPYTAAALASLTTVADHALLLAHVHGTSTAAQGNLRPTAQPAGFAQQFLDDASSPDGSASSDTQWVGGTEVVAPGASGVVTLNGNAQTSVSGYLVALKGITTPTPSGTAQPAGIGTAEAFGTPTAIWTPVHRWLASAQPNAAHRGGDNEGLGEENSATYANAYTFGPSLVLEWSGWFSSDGVFVGSHDQNLQRVFGVNVDVPTSTWASMTGYLSLIGNLPLMRFDDFVAQYGPHRMIMVDNKAGTNMTALLDFCDANGGPARFLFKGFHTLNAALCAQIRARGYKIWLYLYSTTQADLDNLPVSSTHCDLLGLEASASAASFALVKSYSPSGVVLAHSATTAAGNAAALANGATGLMAGKLTGSIVSDQRVPVGIASAQAFGVPTATAGLVALPAGIPTGQAFGVPTAVAVLTAGPVGIPSGQAFGVPTATAGLVAEPVGIPTGQAMGVPTALPTWLARPLPIASGEAFGAVAATAPVPILEAVSALTRDVYDSLPEMYRVADEPPAADHPLLRYLSLVLDPLSSVDRLRDAIDYVAPRDGGAPGATSQLADPGTADESWLPWLAQLLGVSLAGLTVDQARAALADPDATWQHGTVAALAEAAARATTGTHTVQVTYPYDRTRPWVIGLGVMAAEVHLARSWDALEALATGPTGVVSWDPLEAVGPTWDALENAGSPVAVADAERPAGYVLELFFLP